MRRTLQLCRLGLAGAATVAVLTACGGSGGSNTASSGNAAKTTTGSAGTTTSAAAAAVGGGSFCDQARNFATQVTSAVGSLAQQGNNSGQLLQQVVTQLQTITPPGQIASDWQTALSDLQQLAAALGSTNLADPSAAAGLEQKVAPLEGSLTTAGQHIDDYLRTQCGIDVGGAASATS